MSKSSIVSTDFELARVEAALSTMVDKAARLPRSPFRTVGHYSICEYEVMRSSRFGQVLEALAFDYGDQFIRGASVEPDIESEYMPLYGSRGAFELDAAEVATSYGRALAYEPGGDLAGALIVSCDILAITGDSLKWSIWGERRLGVAVIRTSADESNWKPESLPFFSPSNAVDALISLEFLPGEVPDYFRRTFVNSFGN